MLQSSKEDRLDGFISSQVEIKEMGGRPHRDSCDHVASWYSGAAAGSWGAYASCGKLWGDDNGELDEAITPVASDGGSILEGDA